MSGKPAGAPADSCTLVMAAVVINPPRSRMLPKPDLRHGCGWVLTEPIREPRLDEARGAIKVPSLFHQDRCALRFLEGCPANHAVLAGQPGRFDQGGPRWQFPPCSLVMAGRRTSRTTP